MIDICDFAVGLSRQLYGRSIASERPGHRLTETWHPLGPVAVISAFNFPVAVWSWNAALALVCGDPVIWKPSERTPLTAIATTSLLRRAADRFGEVPDGLFELVIGGADRAVQLAEDERIPLVSATGSTAMGKALAPRIAARLGRSLLELGGNNAAIVAPSADLDLVVRAVLFAAVGTAGQRCTSPAPPDRPRVGRRRARRPPRAPPTASVPIGDPREDGTLVGPLVTGEAFGRMEAALGQARDGGRRGRRRRRPRARRARGPTRGTRSRRSCACRRRPTSSRQETFAPILYVLTYGELDEAIALQNGVPQGLASSIFTTDLREAERFLAAAGLGLRDRERQHRPERRRDRRRVRRREGDRRRPRVRLGRLAGVHAPPDRDGELHERAPARAGHPRSTSTRRPAPRPSATAVDAPRRGSAATPGHRRR